MRATFLTPFLDAMRGAPWLRAMARVFEAANAPLYLVGGAVRNPLMGLPMSDIDVCGPALPQAVLAFCEGTAIHAHLRAAHFGTVELHITDAQGARHMAEYTTFREDSYRCGHKPSAVRFTTELSVDSLRRDFSVNALYQRITEGGLGEVIDPTGGLLHMQNGVLHTVTANPDQVLKEDGLRILRAARFQAELGLVPSDELLCSLKAFTPLLRDIAFERLRDELSKILMADLRYPTLKRRTPASASGLNTLAQIGAWPILFGAAAYDGEAVEAIAKLGFTGFAQSATAFASAAPCFSPLPARMALLNRFSSVQALTEIMLCLRFSAKQANEAAVLLHTLQGITEDTLTVLEAAHTGLSALQFVKTAGAALGQANLALHAETLIKQLMGVPLCLRELAVNGNDLLPLFIQNNMLPMEIGKTLDLLWQRVVMRELPNERDALLEQVHNICLHKGK